ncbi:TPA: hypothetical protein PMC35_003841 [Vibrio cholerae]|nr:hypothetical protein [Vibrio cholerae]
MVNQEFLDMTYDELILNLNKLSRIFLELKIDSCNLYYLDGNQFENSEDEGCSSISRIELIQCTSCEFDDLFKSVAFPFFRNSLNKSGPRLVGHVNFTGTNEHCSAASALIKNINFLKNQWGSSLRELYPVEHNKQRFLNASSKYGGISAKSIQRNFPIAPNGIYSANLSWSCKSLRFEPITIDQIPNICSRYGIIDPVDIQNIIDRISIAMSKKGEQMYHKFPIKIHPVQTINYKEFGKSKRKPVRPGLPLITFGNPNIKTNVFQNFDKNIRLRTGNKARNCYFDLIPELGIVQKMQG